jgi:hypothetical protein
MTESSDFSDCERAAADWRRHSGSVSQWTTFPNDEHMADGMRINVLEI